MLSARERLDGSSPKTVFACKSAELIDAASADDVGDAALPGSDSGAAGVPASGAAVEVPPASRPVLPEGVFQGSLADLRDLAALIGTPSIRLGGVDPA
jgi:hypothetical protein